MTHTTLQASTLAIRKDSDTACGPTIQDKDSHEDGKANGLTASWLVYILLLLSGKHAQIIAIVCFTKQ